MDFWIIVAIFVLGVLIGMVSLSRFTDGVIRIDHSNPEKDIYRLEIDNLDNLSKKKRVVLKVDNHAYLSQK